MSTYTPTHCPETGRKFTKAERKAANKARYAAERAAQTPKPKAPKAPKAAKPTMTDEQRLLKMTKAQLVSLIMFHDIPDPEPTTKPKRKKKPAKASKPARVTKAVKRPKRSSEDGLEQAQARTATADKVGKVKKTKVVHALTGKDAQPFEPRMEVPVVERKASKREQLALKLLPGETPEEGVRRSKIQAEQSSAEASRLEAESLLNAEA